MQTFYLSYKVMQTLLMTAVLLSLIVTLFLLLMFHDMRIDKKKWHWNIFAFLFLFFLLNHLAYSFGQIDKGRNYYEVLPVPIWVIWCIVGIMGRYPAEKDNKGASGTEFDPRSDEPPSDRHLLF